MNTRWFCIAMMALMITAASYQTARAEDKEENEQKIAYKECPKAVRKTLAREANGKEIKTVDKETLKGKIVYEADVKIDGHNYEIVVDPKGMLVSKKLDEEDEKAEASEQKSSKHADKDDEEKSEKSDKQRGNEGNEK